MEGGERGTYTVRRFPLLAPLLIMRIIMVNNSPKKSHLPRINKQLITGRQTVNVNSAPLLLCKVMMIYYIFHMLVEKLIHNISLKMSFESRDSDPAYAIVLVSRAVKYML